MHRSSLSTSDSARPILTVDVPGLQEQHPPVMQGHQLRLRMHAMPQLEVGMRVINVVKRTTLLLEPVLSKGQLVREAEILAAKKHREIKKEINWEMKQRARGVPATTATGVYDAAHSEEAMQERLAAVEELRTLLRMPPQSTDKPTPLSSSGTPNRARPPAQSRPQSRFPMVAICHVLLGLTFAPTLMLAFSALLVQARLLKRCATCALSAVARWTPSCTPSLRHSSAF